MEVVDEVPGEEEAEGRAEKAGAEVAAQEDGTITINGAGCSVLLPVLLPVLMDLLRMTTGWPFMSRTTRDISLGLDADAEAAEGDDSNTLCCFVP